MTYFKLKAQVLENSKSLVYKADKTRNSNLLQMNSKLKSLKNWIYHIFQELVKTIKRRRKLSDNDMLRLVIQNEELPNAISTKFNKVQDFKLADLENVINILEYCAIPVEKCKIVVQSVRIPTGKGRLYPFKKEVDCNS